jgi:HSP20 family protein
MTTEMEVKQTEEAQTERARSGRVYRPFVDIMEGKDELLLVADMPGARADSIDIQFEDGNLTIQARVEPRHHEKGNLLLNEYGVGNFYRTFRVSEEIDPAKIHAEYTDGVLTVHLPRAEAAKPRKIEVKTK